MLASELITQVHHREHARLLNWTAQYLGVLEARKLSRYAIVEMWTTAARGDNTKHGPVEHMIRSIEPRVRRLTERRGSYLPVAAPLTVVLPSDTELNELADAYSLVYITALHYEMDWTLRCEAQTWLHHVIDPSGVGVLEWHGTRHLDAGRDFVQAAASALDAGVTVRAGVYDWRDACRRRELDRSRRWLVRSSAHQRGQNRGTEQPVRDQGVPGQEQPEDHVEGSRAARDPAPGEHGGPAH